MLEAGNRGVTRVAGDATMTYGLLDDAEPESIVRDHAATPA